jgi:RNase adaptor protein for sRNA GlmZ degradation
VGRHRSVALVEELREFVTKQSIPVNVTHRDVDRAG